MLAKRHPDRIYGYVAYALKISPSTGRWGLQLQYCTSFFRLSVFK